MIPQENNLEIQFIVENSFLVTNAPPTQGAPKGCVFALVGNTIWVSSEAK